MLPSLRCLGLVTLTLLASCKSFDPKLLNPTSQTVSSKLPAMENRVQSEATVIVGNGGAVVASGSRDVATFFEREVQEVLTEPYGTKRGYLELKVTTTKQRVGLGWAMLSGFTFCVPNLFGMPFATPQVSVTTQLDVLNGQRQLLATYRADAEAKSVTSIYSSTSYADPARVLYLQAVRQCLDQIKLKMSPDAERLRGQLTGI
ncbi:hypothetical protein [Hymenobacter persicinus]|uniref:Lipoprotein n=1 Tax=Hymenobacter persicinus TaxID=2025506 RepID=A0A4V1ZAX4_9BACT|nr:hypothetical protein [Hymenobacter persicinus]RYU80999.1 hypothetical protein EWM57_07090 [Hymenobacter persicinus]